MRMKYRQIQVTLLEKKREEQVHKVPSGDRVQVNHVLAAKVWKAPNLGLWKGPKLLEVYSDDYRGDRILHYVKKLEDENQELRTIMAGERRVEFEQTINLWPIFLVAVVLWCICTLFFFIL